MGDRADICVEQRRKKMAEELWLNYFNRTLLERGVISQAEHNRMVALIANRSSPTKKRVESLMYQKVGAQWRETD